MLYLAFCLSVPWRRDVGYRERLHAWLVISRIGTGLTVLHAISSLASCILFICEGYLVPFDVFTLVSNVPGGYRTHLPLAYLLAEQALQPIFAFHYLLLFYVAGSQRCAYVLSLMSVIDLVTVIPVYLELIELLGGLYAAYYGQTDYHQRMGTAAFNIFRMIRAVKVVRILRMSQLFAALYRAAFQQIKRTTQQSRVGSTRDAGQSREAQNQQFKLLTSIALLVVITTGFVQWLSIEFGWITPMGVRALQFHEALYYTVVTLSTLGYGEYVPAEGVGQFVMTILIVAFTIFVPYRASAALHPPASHARTVPAATISCPPCWLTP